MPKSSNTPEYSRNREFKGILEDLQGQFRVFGEGQQMLTQKVDTLGTRMDHLDHRVKALEHLPHAVKALHNEFHQFRSFIQKVLPEVATKDDLRRLQKRLTTLETSR